jgi:hypothetical protein
MSLNARLYRQDRQPLGTIEQVQEILNGVFTRTRFVTIASPGSGIETLKPSWITRALLFLLSSPTRYPYWEGYFEGQEFAVVFNLGSDPLVRSVRVTLFGRGTPAAKPHFDVLTSQTGWRLKFY